MGTTTPVDEYADGRSFYEVWDMAGNVYEWCRDSFDDEYYKNTVRQPIQVGLRGVGTDDTWWLLSGDTTYRLGASEVSTRDNIGFRLAMAIDAMNPS